MAVLKVIFMRHAEKAASSQARKRDPGLTDKGVVQAINSGRYLESESPTPFNETIGAIVISPYKRTIQTAVLAFSQTDFDDSNVPILFLEPLLGERYKKGDDGGDINIRSGTETDKLLEYIRNGELEKMIMEALENSGQFDTPEALALAQEKARKIIKAIDSSNMGRTQNWWPAGHLAEEPLDDIRARVQTVNNKKYGDRESDDKPRFYVTHSSTIQGPLENVYADPRDLVDCEIREAEFEQDTSKPKAVGPRVFPAG